MLLDKLGLPQAERLNMPLNEFVSERAAGLGTLPTDKVYVNIAPTADGIAMGLKRERANEVPKDEVLPFVRQKVAESLYHLFTINAYAAHHNYFAGLGIIAQDRFQFMLEMKRGMMAGLAWGTETPEYVMRRNPDTGIAEWSFRDPALQEAAMRALLRLEHYGSTHSTLEFAYPAYFEFSLIKRAGENLLRPIFHDLIIGEAAKPYSLPEVAGRYAMRGVNDNDFYPPFVATR